MGDRRGEGNNSGEEVRVVLPSKARKYVYCPRRYFFEEHLGLEYSLRDRLRMLLGTLFHALLALADRARGRVPEETVRAPLGRYLIVGRPDSYELGDGFIRVVERKSGRAPRRGAWLSDLVQAALYGLALRLSGRDAREVILELSYAIGGTRVFMLNEDLVDISLRVVEESYLVSRYGIVPAALPSNAKCSKCPFREECTALDDELEPPGDGELYEPGAWLRSLSPAASEFNPARAKRS